MCSSYRMCSHATYCHNDALDESLDICYVHHPIITPFRKARRQHTARASAAVHRHHKPSRPPRPGPNALDGTKRSPKPFPAPTVDTLQTRGTQCRWAVERQGADTEENSGHIYGDKVVGKAAEATTTAPTAPKTRDCQIEQNRESGTPMLRR